MHIRSYDSNMISGNYLFSDSYSFPTLRSTSQNAMLSNSSNAIWWSLCSDEAKYLKLKFLLSSHILPPFSLRFGRRYDLCSYLKISLLSSCLQLLIFLIPSLHTSFSRVNLQNTFKAHYIINLKICIPCLTSEPIHHPFIAYLNLAWLHFHAHFSSI